MPLSLSKSRSMPPCAARSTTLCEVRYSDMTNKELQALSDKKLRAMRWDVATDLTTFMADLAGQIAFLNRHQFAPTAGEQVLLLQTAVAHVHVFANKVDAAFHMQHPMPSEPIKPCRTSSQCM